MLDTVNMFLPKEKIANSEILMELRYLLTDPKEIKSLITNSISITGNYKNYRVHIGEKGLSLSGSLCKYYLGNNIRTLDNSTVKDAINMLSDNIHLPLKDATLRRIDLAENFEMRYEVPLYYSLLGSTDRYKRLEQNNGINYRMTIKEMLFYGKIPELRENGVEIPERYNGVNLLRYEFRLKNHLSQQLKTTELNVSRLYNEQFYKELINIWKAEYNSIYKYKQHNINLNSINNVKQFKSRILLEGIKSLGGESEALKIIEQAKNQGYFKNKMQVKRFKDLVKSICNEPNSSFESDAIDELNKKINEIQS